MYLLTALLVFFNHSTTNINFKYKNDIVTLYSKELESEFDIILKNNNLKKSIVVKKINKIIYLIYNYMDNGKEKTVFVSIEGENVVENEFDFCYTDFYINNKVIYFISNKLEIFCYNLKLEFIWYNSEVGNLNTPYYKIKFDKYIYYQVSDYLYVINLASGKVELKLFINIQCDDFFVNKNIFYFYNYNKFEFLKLVVTKNNSSEFDIKMQKNPNTLMLNGNEYNNTDGYLFKNGVKVCELDLCRIKIINNILFVYKNHNDESEIIIYFENECKKTVFNDFIVKDIMFDEEKKEMIFIGCGDEQRII
tara:strand:+ start:165 stop:1085 length:921 start_codon:yes stop_codon:yes gene_type:complete